MAYSDLELGFLLTAYGQKLYGIALAHTNHKENALEILQKVFLELVCFPPVLKENQTKEAWLMERTKKLCKAYPKDSSHLPLQEPLSEEEEDELLALMQEARDHEGLLSKPKKSKKPLSIAVSAAGVFLIIAITIVALLGGKGKTYMDEQGSDDLLAPPANQQEQEQNQDPPKQENPAPAPNEVDPLPPEIINNSSCVTFPSLSEFAAAIEQRSAAGYGKSYYNARPLLLLPARLPDDAVFRCLYLYPQSGDYSYSFRFEYQKTLYLLEFKVDAFLPATAMEVGDYTAAIRQETPKREVAKNILSYTFGKDRVTVTLSAPKSEQPIDEALAKKLFSTVILERCSAENPFLK